MSFRRACVLLLALATTLGSGCKRKHAPPPPPPPEKPKPKEEPKEDPKPEPKPEGPAALKLPEKAAAEPWLVGRAADPLPSAAVTIPAVPPLSMTGLAVRPALNRAVVTARAAVTKKGAPPATRVIFCDTAAGKVLNEWPIPGDHAVLDISPDGRSILATSPNLARGRETLRVWLIGSNGQIKRWSFEPHGLPAAGAPEAESGRVLTESEAVAVRWAAFVGNGRIVSVSWAGQLRVWDPDGPKLLASIDATPCRPALTPDGSRVAFLAGESVALLDPAACAVTDVRPVGPPPLQPVLAFSPDGARLAVGGNGEAIVLDLATAAVRHLPLPKLRVTDNGTYDRSFAWAGKDHLLADQQLYDPDFPVPAWEYRGAELAQVGGWQAWVCVRGPMNSSTLRAVTLPHADLKQQVAAAKGSPGRFALKPGDRVRVDVREVPAERQAAVKAALENRLKELGYLPDDAGAATLAASVDLVGIKSDVTYVVRQEIPYVRRPAKLQLVMDGKELWSEAWCVPPPLCPAPKPGEKLDKWLQRCGAGEPNYDLFKMAPLPAYVLPPAATTPPLGSSEFTPTGFKDGPAPRG